jgi:hypothetical protein
MAVTRRVRPGTVGTTRTGAAWVLALAGRAGFGRGPRKEGHGLEGEKMIFKFPFSINFQITVFKSYFEQENDLF